jgi:hypothetical protein
LADGEQRPEPDADADQVGWWRNAPDPVLGQQDRTGCQQRLHRAIALRHLAGPEAAMRELDGLAEHPDAYPLFHATRAELLRALGAGGGVFVMISVVFLVLAVQDGGLFTGVIGVISAGFFGPFVLYAVLGLVGPRGGVLLLPEGVFCRLHAGTAWLPWRTFQVRAENRASQAMSRSRFSTQLRPDPS